ncbi:LOW QUALITY PROTEIN: uncharacterized protein ACMZJ9_017894 [Mantella aurantiaca]
MKGFLSDSVSDRKTKQKKCKGIIVQGLVSCCTKLMEVVNEKEKLIFEQGQKHEIMERELKEKISDLRLHAITSGEALIEKAKLCELTQENEELLVKIQIVERELEDIAFDRLAEKSNYQTETSKAIKEYKQIYPWDDLNTAPTLPAAPTTTTTVLNTDNSSEVQLITKHLKPQEMEAIVREIGQVPRYDINRFMKWFCDLQRARETYSLNIEDLGRILQKVVGNGLWIRILQNCGQRHKTKDVLRELLKALYGVTTNVSLSGKIKQMKNECPYELTDRIASVMENVMPGNPGFERGGMIHRAMLLEALDSEVREGILSVTPDPVDYNDILLRADNLWRRKCRENSFAVDAAKVFRIEGNQNRADFKEPIRRRDYNSSGGQRRIERNEPENRRCSRNKTWIPFPQLKQEHDHLKMEYDKIKVERDKLIEEVLRLQSELRKCNVVGLPELISL